MLKVADSAVSPLCWSCSVAQNETTLFCPKCGKIQPPPGGDFFSVLGLEPRLNIDLAALEGEFHRLSRKLHPDRFARATESEREWSLADTALLNDAYRTLKDPLRRTEYVLKMRGARNETQTGNEFGTQIDEEHGRERQNASPAAADLLEEVFDLNMRLEAMRLRRQSGNVERQSGKVDQDLEESLCAAERRFKALRDEVDRNLRAAWNDWDGGDTRLRSAAEKTMAGLLDRRRYLSNLVRDVSAALAAG